MRIVNITVRVEKADRVEQTTIDIDCPRARSTVWGALMKAGVDGWRASSGKGLSSCFGEASYREGISSTVCFFAVSKEVLAVRRMGFGCGEQSLGPAVSSFLAAAGEIRRRGVSEVAEVQMRWQRVAQIASGIWYIAQAQSLIRLSMGIVLRARGAPVPLRAVLVIVLRARVPPYLYGESVRGRSRQYGNRRKMPCLLFVCRVCLGLLQGQVKVKVGAELNRFRFPLGRKMPSLLLVIGYWYVRTFHRISEIHTLIHW